MRFILPNKVAALIDTDGILSRIRSAFEDLKVRWTNLAVLLRYDRFTRACDPTGSFYSERNRILAHRGVSGIGLVSRDGIIEPND